MSKIIEKNVAEIIMLSILIIILMSSCVSTYKYKELVVIDCENCDEID